MNTHPHMEDELTEKMHSEFTVDKETEIKHKAMSLWTLLCNNRNHPKFKYYCDIFALKEEDAIRWLPFCKRLSRR